MMMMQNERGIDQRYANKMPRPRVNHNEKYIESEGPEPENGPPSLDVDALSKQIEHITRKAQEEGAPGRKQKDPINEKTHTKSTNLPQQKTAREQRARQPGHAPPGLPREAPTQRHAGGEQRARHLAPRPAGEGKGRHQAQAKVQPLTLPARHEPVQQSGEDRDRQSREHLQGTARTPADVATYDKATKDTVKETSSGSPSTYRGT